MDLPLVRAPLHPTKTIHEITRNEDTKQHEVDILFKINAYRDSHPFFRNRTHSSHNRDLRNRVNLPRSCAPVGRLLRSGILGVFGMTDVEV